jgi:phosphotransacetylase
MPRKIKIDIADFKQELKFMIDRESDIALLKAVENLIAQGKTQKTYVRRLIEGARRAEEDIKAGRVYTSEEFKARSDKYLASLYSKAKSSAKKK